MRVIAGSGKGVSRVVLPVVILAVIVLLSVPSRTGKPGGVPPNSAMSGAPPASTVAGYLSWQLPWFRRRESPPPPPVLPEPVGVIVVDAGHGGVDGGTSGNGILEKDLNLSMSLLLRELLAAHNFDVVMTREGDYALSDVSHRLDLQARVDIIESAGALLFVSVHANWVSNPARRGALTFYHFGSAEGRRLAESIQRSLNAVQRSRRIQEYPAPADFYVLRNTSVPGVTVEMGFLSSEEDSRYLSREEYRHALAEAIVEGVLTFLEEEDSSRSSLSRLERFWY